jgi:hypothetical protein
MQNDGQLKSSIKAGSSQKSLGKRSITVLNQMLKSNTDVTDSIEVPDAGSKKGSKPKTDAIDNIKLSNAGSKKGPIFNKYVPLAVPAPCKHATNTLNPAATPTG